ncbi:MAG: sigma-70 family RNA polymerase sigma factor [Heliobacteriaceae bacterium]|nr:sigma-70 family RNA polymerase sigma factor [Heliobacteriaceae bacterium]
MGGSPGKEAVKVWDDKLWWQKYISGDDAAFEALIRHYQNYVFAVILNFTGSDEAADIAQEVFLTIYRSLPGFQPHNLKAWIGKVAVTKAIDWKRRRSRTELEQPEIDISTIPETGLGPEEELLAQEQRRLLKEICQSLPPVYEKTVNKYYYEKKSYQQIAREEGVSIKTVESRLYRARALIRQCWEEVEK